MAPPLLQTKLHIPPVRPELVSRPRLVERLNTCLSEPGFTRKLTLVSAPAGFGKTTLVSEWVTRCSHLEPKVQGAWLSLDEPDNDSARFLAYLIAALRTIDSSIGRGIMSALQSPQPPLAEVVLTQLINEILAIPGSIILVLDDYHLLEAQAIHGALAFLLEHLPPKMHLIIATREDPPLPLARLRARDQLTELRAADLRFTAPEAADFLNRVMGLDLSSEDVAALEARTEGWIAGLQLAAISMQGRKEPATLIESFAGSHRYVMDYLIEEVLKRQSDSVQRFLLQTSVLDRLTGSLCDAVLGAPCKDMGQANGSTELRRVPCSDTASSQSILEMLERANLFIIPLDEERRWYRYHHLFADLLRQRLRQAQPGMPPILNTRASEWFAHQGLDREAIKHSLAAQDYQGAAELIRTVAIDTIQQGEHTTVLGWVNALPEESVREQPYLGVLYAWALQLTGQLETSEARLIDAENALLSPEHQDDENADTILGLINSRRAYSAFVAGEHDQVIAFARQALDQLPESSAWTRARTALLLGVCYRYRGQLRAALGIYHEILPIAQRMGSNSLVVWCCLHLGDLLTDMAQLHRAREVYEQALESTERHAGRREMPSCGYVYVGIGRILRQWDQLEDAHRYASTGVALCRDWNVAEILALSCIELAYVQRALGSDEQSRASIQEAIRIMDGFSPWGSKHATAHQVKLNMARGDLDSAERWAQANDLPIDGDFEFHREIEYLTLVRLFIAQKRFEQAYALAQRICRIAQEIGKRQTELEGLMLVALIFSVQGEASQGLVHLEKALSIAEPEGYIRIFVDEGPPMAELLYKALRRGIAPDYVRRLLAAFPVVEPEGTASSSPQIPKSELIEPLSERELEVLQLIAEGLANREIAARLFLSVNTVKAHSRNIYGKLGAHNRTEAAARAQALGILPST